MESYSPGLDGVIAVETGISFLDTQQGSILIKGHDLIELSKTAGYMDIVHLLLEDRLPDAKEKKALEEDVRRGGHLPEEILRICRLFARTYSPDGRTEDRFVRAWRL